MSSREFLKSGDLPYNAPHETIEKMHRATAELKATGICKNVGGVKHILGTQLLALP
jgi:hypothetical protein